MADFHTCRSTHRVSHPHSGLRDPKLHGLISCRLRPWDSGRLEFWQVSNLPDPSNLSKRAETRSSWLSRTFQPDLLNLPEPSHLSESAETHSSKLSRSFPFNGAESFKSFWPSKRAETRSVHLSDSSNSTGQFVRESSKQTEIHS
jgi:hypothetical protein